ncbi:MAG: LacI family transcriptional regulator [Chloroflexi bacterium]|nr:MAG: LacI family transcriptional regulator [Chloroflexota bacterium]MBL1192966.1 LacI family transcriptional regulator [Chloroflexota bacterium]NOH10258.1 LacI family DNA-binding transcriptional regulator [Chloroflexota bacterium]
MTKIKDVAERAGVSTATVSRVLGNKPYVRDEVRARVMQAVEELNYRPNLVARSLRAQRSNTIGLIVADIRNPFFTDISRAVEDTAYSQDFSVFLCNTDEDPEKEALYIDLMRDENVAGVILAPTRKTAKNFTKMRLGYPTVVIDRSVPINDSSKHDLILIDNQDAAYRLTTHLIENGYKNIAGLFGKDSYTGKERHRGFIKALKENKMAIPDEYVRFVPSKKAAGCAAAQELFELKSPPDALLTTNSLFTAGVLEAAQESSLSIPADIALAGFDDAPWTTLVEPKITVIAQPTMEIGRSATELLLNRISEPDLLARKITLQGKLIARQSSASQV